MEGSSVWMICTTRPSFLPGKRLMSKLSWCFSSYVSGRHFFSGSQVFNFFQIFLKWITEKSKLQSWSKKKSCVNPSYPGSDVGLPLFCLSVLFWSSLFFLLFAGTSDTAVRAALSWRRFKWTSVSAWNLSDFLFFPFVYFCYSAEEKYLPACWCENNCVLPKKNTSRKKKNLPDLYPPVLAPQQAAWHIRLSSPIYQKQPSESGLGLLVHLESLQNSSQTHPEAHVRRMVQFCLHQTKHFWVLKRFSSQTDQLKFTCSFLACATTSSWAGLYL